MRRRWIAPFVEIFKNTDYEIFLMTVTDGASVTETPWLKRGSMRYASAPDSDGTDVKYHAGWEPPLVPVELCPLPVLRYWHGRAVKQEAPSFTVDPKSFYKK
ncbi:Hypothetical protein SSO2887 [Saccharolobus solfataricus P2]|uniref:Uncharacterized protein n=2 Tax=Saccharolobus solfataricus TaxID=2287 RepID=Q97UV6_SACS2|nr:Hypothetical protein SSO2887 [Saccharolobus solfataricus P2]SAI86538.1 uncharacterised protein [Saccharolobus solfataricus]